MTHCVAIVQKNEQPEDESIHSQELVILEGKQLHSMRYNPSSLAFDFPQMTALVRAFGREVPTDWEVLDGRAYAVVDRVTEPAKEA